MSLTGAPAQLLGSLLVLHAMRMLACCTYVFLMPCSVQLVKRYEAAVRVCNWNQGPYQRVRNVGNIVEKEREIKAQVESEGGLVA